jgi:hypothetical protein
MNRRTIWTILGACLGVTVLVLALWAWRRDEDLATRFGAHNLALVTWAVRCAAVALVAAGEAQLVFLVIANVWRRDLLTNLLGLSAALVFALAAASAVALGLAGR